MKIKANMGHEFLAENNPRFTFIAFQIQKFDDDNVWTIHIWLLFLGLDITIFTKTPPKP